MIRPDLPAHRADADLRQRLRAGDPLAAANEPEDAALGRLARRVAAIEPAAARHGWRPVLLASATAALLVAVALGLRSTGRSAEPTSTEAPEATQSAAPPPFAGGSSARDEVRQLQFETPGGTRVVWMLDPNLTL